MKKRNSEMIKNRSGAGTPDLNKFKIPTNIESYTSKTALKSQRLVYGINNRSSKTEISY